MQREIELSVVTGTYNRLRHMQDMIRSVRESIGIGIPYEIVLVDGGSTDGTIEWARTQPDIVLIEQGGLLGAIKAFNAGLFAARGRYCVVGNDDITYIDETFLNALAFMQDNPNVGVGCFYQDRDHPGHFSLSYMPAILNDQQLTHVYGQVCIVPRWLGNEVGWWGAFPNQRTYGGDNNLSSFVLEMGYRVTGIRCACIHDMQVDDDLRKINNEQMQTSKRSHPDSEGWGKNWTHRDGSCGALIRTEPVKPNPLKRKTRFLYLPIYEQGHSIQKGQKKGLRLALANHGLVYEYDWLEVAAKRGGKYMIDYFMDLIESWKPDVILTQIHGPDARTFNASTVSKIRKEFPSPIWVNWNGDYHPEDLLSPQCIKMCKQFDLQCVVTTAVREAYAQSGVSWMYWQIGYETSGHDNNMPHHDVVFLGSGYSAARINLGRMLRSLPYNVGIYGSWGSGGVSTDGSNLYNFTAGEGLYRNAKVSIGDNQWGNRAVGFVSNRLFQAMAAGGALLLHQHVPDLDKLLGLKSGEHYIAWRDIHHLRQALDYWLDPAHDAERRGMADAGTSFIRQYHSFDARVSELMEVIG